MRAARPEGAGGCGSAARQRGGGTRFPRRGGPTDGDGFGGIAQSAPVLCDDDAVFGSVNVVANRADKGEDEVLVAHLVANSRTLLRALLLAAAVPVFLTDPGTFS